jgi:transcriptional regulator CtsR
VTLAEMIEAYLLRLVEEMGEFEVKRSDLAAQFRCVPSQITYVLDTRFTPERGFLVESRRGEGGFVRIKRLDCPSIVEVLKSVAERDGVDQRQAQAFVERLAAQGLLTKRERAMMARALDRETAAPDRHADGAGGGRGGEGRCSVSSAACDRRPSTSPES